MTTNVGQVYLPSNGVPVGQFKFIVDRDSGVEVEIGAAVAVDTKEGIVIGTVNDMVAIGWAHDAFAADLLGDSSSLDRRDEVLVATAQVFHAPRLRPVRSGAVRPATAEEVLQATGSKNLTWGIPVGTVDLLGGERVPVSLDGFSLLGPDAAHCLVGGISGQASKTSFAGVLLRSAMAHGSPSKNSVAAVLFNVKGEDLLFLDKTPSANQQLDERDKAIYAAMGLDPTPFPSVNVYAPPQLSRVGSAREDAHILQWELPEIWGYLHYLWPHFREDEKLSAFSWTFQSQYLDKASPSRYISSYTKLMEWIRQEIADADDANVDTTRGTRTHIATMRRVYRMFSSLGSTLGGILVKGTGAPSDVPTEYLHHGQVIVIDVAGMNPQAQGLVVGRISDKLLRSAENGSLGVDHLVMFADELNAFAPAHGGEAASVKKVLQRVVTQGRYAGVSLWGAAQKLSKIDDLIRDNAATIALGRTAPAEIDSNTYGRISPGFAEQVATLERGQMAVWHYTLRSPLVVRFPRPAWQTGRSAKTLDKRPRAQLEREGLSQDSIAAVTEGIPEQTVENIVADSSNVEEAVERLKEVRTPDPSRVMLSAPRPEFDPNNPFEIDD